MTVYVADAHAHVQRLVSVVKMATVPEAYTTEKQRSVLHFLWKKDSLQRIFINKRFLFTVGSVCRVKWFTTWSRNSLRDVRKSQMMLDQVRKWLRQQSKDLCAVGFDALVKRWDKYVSIGKGMSRNIYFLRFEYHMFYVLYLLVNHLLTLPHIIVIIILFTMYVCFNLAPS
jgi:hypothetical protein